MSQVTKRETSAKCPKCGSAVSVYVSQYNPATDENENPLVEAIGVACTKCEFKEEWNVE